MSFLIRNSGEVPVIALLGLGIKGATIAAMLAASDVVKVIGIEPFEAGSGISSTNHGRFHSGTWNFDRNLPQTIIRNRISRQLMDQLSDVWESEVEGLYCIESDSRVFEFCNFFHSLGIDFSRVLDLMSADPWVNYDRYTVFRIPETSFNPASFAERCTHFAAQTGRCEIVRGSAQRLDSSNGKFTITLSTGKTLKADAVVNAMGGWLPNLQSDLPLWRPKLMWSLWRLLCLNTDAIGKARLNHTITIDRRKTAHDGQGPIAGIPHGSWIVFGCDMPARLMSSQDEVPPGEGWRPIDFSDEMDNLLFTSHAAHFPTLRDLAARNEQRAIYSFPGVYPETISEASAARLVTGVPSPYSATASWAMGNFPRYFPILGGSASSSLIDAQDASRHILYSLGLTADNHEEWIKKMAANFPPNRGGTMIWDKHRIPNLLPLVA